MCERVGEQLGVVAERHSGETVVVVTSGGPVGASFMAFGSATNREAVEMAKAIRNTSLTSWVRHDRVWTLERRDEIPHLATATGDKPGEIG